MKNKLSLIVFLLFLALTYSSCKRNHSCFDAQLYQKNKGSICTEDCPGFIGCDGKEYCNECIANTQGIRGK